MSTVKPQDKTYKLINGTPLSYTLPSRNHPRFPLMWYDESKNENRALRYARNQKSPFEDEQDGNAILEPVVFEDGLLFVPKNNPVLQAFLHYHPQNGVVFVEVNKEKDAEKDLEFLDLEADAMIAARGLTIDQVELLTRVIFGKDPSYTSTAELKRDIIVYARNEPQEFMQFLNDPELNFQGKVRLFFDLGYLALRNNDKEVWFNTKTNKKKMMSVPFNDQPLDAVCQYLKSDDGIDSLKMLEALIEE